MICRLRGQFAVHIKPLRGAVVYADDVMPPARLKGPIRRQVRQRLVPLGVEPETEPILAIAQQPAFFVRTIVLQRADDPTPLHRFPDAHPRLKGQFALGQIKARDVWGNLNARTPTQKLGIARIRRGSKTN